MNNMALKPHPLNNPEIMHPLSQFLSEYQVEFVSSLFRPAVPGPIPLHYGKYLARAAAAGDTHIVMWLLDEGARPLPGDNIINRAADGGHPDTVARLIEAGFTCCQITMMCAAQSGSLDVLKLVKNSSPYLRISRAVCRLAKVRGDRECIDWLRAQINATEYVNPGYKMQVLLDLE